MSTVKVPIFNPVYRNVDEVELQDQNYLLMNGYLSELGGTNKRPGMMYNPDFALGGSSSDGIYWWTQRDRLLVVQDSHLYDIHKVGNRFYTTDLGSSAELQIRKRPIFCSYGYPSQGDYVFLANGGKIHYTDPSNNYTLTAISDADAPTQVTHVAYLDGYILANKVNSNFWYWSDLNDPTSWTATSFASAAGNADYVIALHVMNRQIYLFGTETMEIWENDGENPFSRVPGGFQNTGCIAPYSVVSNEGIVYWLSNNRRLVSYNGNSIQRISTPYDKEIETFSNISDCIADKVEIDGKTFLVFTFKTEGRTLVYNLTSDNWSEFGEYIAEEAKYKQWRVNGYTFAASWGMHLVADSKTGNVFELSSKSYMDYDEPIRLKRVTGLIDYGTSAEKRCGEIRLRVKRGVGTGNPHLMIRWKDDNKNWSNEHWIDLGNSGEREIVKRLFPHGIYRTRQYEFTATSSVPIIFIDAEEDVEVLE